MLSLVVGDKNDNAITKSRKIWQWQFRIKNDYGINGVIDFSALFLKDFQAPLIGFFHYFAAVLPDF